MVKQKKTDEEILAEYKQHMEEVKRKILAILFRAEKKVDDASYKKVLTSIAKK